MADSELRVCVVCNKTEVDLPTGSGLKRCARCQQVTYCSKGSSAVAVATLSLSLSLNHSRFALQNVRQLTGRNTRPHVHDRPQQTPTPPPRLFPLPTPTSSA